MRTLHLNAPILEKNNNETMDKEKRLLLLQLKSDLKEVLRLTREKSDELIVAFRKENEKTNEKVDDLEYYLTSLLDITKEMKKLCSDEKITTESEPKKINIDSTDFDNFLNNLSKSNDSESLQEVLDVLENWERYELCAVVNNKIKLVMAKSA